MRIVPLVLDRVLETQQSPASKPKASQFRKLSQVPSSNHVAGEHWIEVAPEVPQSGTRPAEQAPKLPQSPASRPNTSQSKKLSQVPLPRSDSDRQVPLQSGSWPEAQGLAPDPDPPPEEPDDPVPPPAAQSPPSQFVAAQFRPNASSQTPSADPAERIAVRACTVQHLTGRAAAAARGVQAPLSGVGVRRVAGVAAGAVVGVLKRRRVEPTGHEGVLRLHVAAVLGGGVGRIRLVQRRDHRGAGCRQGARHQQGRYNVAHGVTLEGKRRRGARASSPRAPDGRRRAGRDYGIETSPSVSESGSGQSPPSKPNSTQLKFSGKKPLPSSHTPSPT